MRVTSAGVRSLPGVLVALVISFCLTATAVAKQPESIPNPQESIVPGQYIVVLEDSVGNPAAVADAQTERHGGKVGFVYSHALNGYSAKLSEQAVEALERNPNVKYVSPVRRMEATAQTVPTGVKRISALGNPALDIDETDDVRIDADVAVIDTGIDYTHPDLNVVSRTNCVPPKEDESEWSVEKCVDNTGTDGRGHGTHVAGTIGALDNGFGAVGVAPGARLWAVRVLNNKGGGFDPWVVAGIDWVTARASQIEVINMSLGGEGTSKPLEEAIDAAVNAGVVVVVAAGNEDSNAAGYSPANVPAAITVSALVDYNGASGGNGGPAGCGYHGPDDTLASFSNWGSKVDIAAPGVCIFSTFPVGGSGLGTNYGSISGTSMASPHVAGAAAVLAAKSNPNSKEAVESIRKTLQREGSLNWNDLSEDEQPEQLLYLGASPLAGREAATGGWSSKQQEAATLYGAVKPRGIPVTYRFEYGPTTEYGKATTWTSVGSATDYAAVSQNLTGLSRGTTYHYRIVVSSSGETVYGMDKTFDPSLWNANTTSGAPTYESERLTDVSCYSSNCLAVGWGYDGKNQVLSYKLTPGTKEWTYKPIPTPTGFNSPWLEGVSCISGSVCTAVGEMQVTGGSTVVPFAERWDGTQWKEQAVPAPPTQAAQPYAPLIDVSCPVSTFCMAVGYYKVEDTNGEEPGGSVWRVFTSKWQGGQWTNSYPLPVGVGDLTSISCPGVSFCAAVGTETALTWSNDTWTSHSPAENGWNPKVTCLSATFCMSENNDKYLEKWDGTGWSLAHERQAWPIVNAIACYTTTSCGLVGREWGRGDPIVDRWNGVTVTREPSIRDSERIGSYTGIDCLSENQCYAVGYLLEGSRKALIASAPDWRPVVTNTYPAEAIGGREANVSGKIETKGLPTTFRFEYGTTTAYGSSAPVPDGSVGVKQTGTSPVSRKLEGLKPLTEYHYRLVATNGSGAVAGPDMTFKTTVAPRATTIAASDIKGREATLNGIVNPEGIPTTYRFEYGPTVAYGSSAPVPDASAGSGEGDFNVSQAVTGLQPLTTYHFRLAATNSKGTAYGADLVFRTGASGDLFDTMEVTQPFDGSAGSTSAFSSKWATLGWLVGLKGTDSATGWRPDPLMVGSIPYYFPNGAYYTESLMDAGAGVAASAQLSAAPGENGSYFSVFLDAAGASSQRNGYELRFTRVSANTYDVKLSMWQGGTQTVLATKSSYSLPVGSSVAIADEGGDVSAWIDSGSGFAKLLGAQDASLGSGHVGIEGVGSELRLKSFRAGALIPEAADMNAALAALTVRDSFAYTFLPSSAWAALAWPSSPSGNPRGWVENGWRPYDAAPTVNGAYWQSATFLDSGSGDAVAARMTASPGGSGSYFSLWLNAPTPGSAKSGYELRVAYVSAGKYDVALSRWQSGTKTVLASTPEQSLPVDSRVALVAKGGTVSAWTKTGTEYAQLLSAADSTFASGYGGVEGVGTSTRLKDFAAGPVAPLK